MKEKGFTLMEITIVLAVLAIIAAILIPTFMATTDRARLRSDIQSARVIQNALDLYVAERGRLPVTAVGASQIIQVLQDTDFLPQGNINTQTANASWQIDSNRVFINIRESSNNVKRIFENLSDDEKGFVKD